jgi:hypothetical protein
LEELVANSFDAGALHVQVPYSANLHDQNASIVVIDDGKGMGGEELKQHWLIGISNKRSLSILPHGRRQIGQFGIGKLATYVLANRLTHISKHRGKYYSTSMDYTAIDRRVDKEVELQVPIDIALRELTEAQATVMKAIGSTASARTWVPAWAPLLSETMRAPVGSASPLIQ